MTLPSSGAITTQAILDELKVANPTRGSTINFSDSDVLALAGKTAGQSVVLPSDFHGKSVSGVSLSNGSLSLSGSSPSVTFNTNGTITYNGGASGPSNWYSPTTTAVGASGSGYGIQLIRGSGMPDINYGSATNLVLSFPVTWNFERGMAWSGSGTLVIYAPGGAEHSNSLTVTETG